jgi:hypothetical protein
MSECPRCHQALDVQAIACPRCRMPLKAHGHPGIPLHRAMGNDPLCLTCTYDADDSCTFPKRPQAMDCTLYCDRTQSPVTRQHSGYTIAFQLTAWIKRHQTWLLLLGLVLISLILAVMK